MINILVRINTKINYYILKYDWSKSMSSLINKEIEIDENDLKIFPVNENGDYIPTIQLEADYRVYYIPLECLAYQNIEIRNLYKELKSNG